MEKIAEDAFYDEIEKISVKIDIPKLLETLAFKAGRTSKHIGQKINPIKESIVESAPVKDLSNLLASIKDAGSSVVSSARDAGASVGRGVSESNTADILRGLKESVGKSYSKGLTRPEGLKEWSSFIGNKILGGIETGAAGVGAVGGAFSNSLAKELKTEKGKKAAKELFKMMASR